MWKISFPPEVVVSICSVRLRAVVDRLLALDFATMLVWVLGDNPACHFYERLGGRHVGTKAETIGGVTLEELAYGWDDLAMLARSLRARLD